jgi:hypothetical protein
MKNLSSPARTYILGIILIGLGLIAWMALEVDWTKPGLYLLAALGAVAQTLKVEGPNEKTNYSIAWFVYGFAFLAGGLASALFVILVAHLVDWIWHRYPWYIQSFNIANHALAASLAGLVFEAIQHGPRVLDTRGAVALVAANLIFVLANHFLVGLVVKLARSQSFAESGVFEFLTLSLDFTVLTLGVVTALAWSYNPFLAVLNFPLLYPLYQALRVPALKRLEQLRKISPRMSLDPSGD